MMKILQAQNDDANFIRIIEQIVNFEVVLAQPEDVFVTKVNHWFDFKWRGFSHKIFGALGIWRDWLRIPPFIPDRIVEELYFQKVNDTYEQKDLYRLHIYQNSAENASRKINHTSAIFIWYSGETAINSQGSLMVYKLGIDSQNSWYASFIKKSDWQIYKTDNISKGELKAMFEINNLSVN